MLKAILSGKAVRLPIEIHAGASWSQAFKRSEDLLTATVFERLSYLPGEQFWKVLRATFGPILPDFRVATLTSIEFWPRWDDTLTGGTVEPDLFMQFELGDPTQRVDILLEAKLDGRQYSEQWRRQWVAYQKFSHSEEEGGRLADAVFFLAMGGISGSAPVMAARYTSEIEALSEGSTKFLAAAADWSQITTALTEITAKDPANERIVTDIQDALALFGYRHMQTLASLSRMEKLRNAADSLNFLRLQI